MRIIFIAGRFCFILLQGYFILFILHMQPALAIVLSVLIFG